jgi:hypothetical protein
VVVESSIYNNFLDLGFLHRGTIHIHRGTMSNMVVSWHDEKNFLHKFCGFSSILSLSHRGTMQAIVARCAMSKFSSFLLLFV